MKFNYKLLKSKLINFYFKIDCKNFYNNFYI